MQNSTSRFYRVGGLNFQLIMPEFPEIEELRAFRAEPCEPDIVCRVRLGRCNILPQGNILKDDGYCTYYQTEQGLARTFKDERDGSILMVDLPAAGGRSICFDEEKVSYLSSHLALRILDMPRRVIERGGIFLHASFISFDGGAILFTAPKGVGKSTQASLWQKYRGAEIINGDRAVIRKCGGQWFAWGSPYCGTSGICQNRSMPLRAVVVLTQAKENTAQRLEIRHALAAMLDGSSFDAWDMQQVSRVMEICGQLIEDIPFYRLSCLADEGAVRALEECLWK